MGNTFFKEFVTIVLVHFIVVVTPGADFAMIVRQSYLYGRRTAVFSSIGIGLGMLLHFTYTIVGLGLVIYKSILAYNTIKILGAAYLCYLGIKSLRTHKQAKIICPESNMASFSEPNGPSAGGAVWAGFLVNALNPKATLFFLSIFSVIVSPSTPLLFQIGYCAWIFFMQVVWFSFVAIIFSQNAVRTKFRSMGHWMERVMGAVLIGLGIRLVLSAHK